MPRHITVVGASAPSHVHPTLGLVRELTRRGHRVTYAVAEHLAPLVAGAGAEPISCTTVLPRGDGRWPDGAIAAMGIFLDEGIHVLPQVTAALDGDPPDLVLHDIGGLAGPVAAERWGVPAVQLSPAFVAWEGYEEDMADAIAAMRAEPGADASTRVPDWLGEHGVAREPDDVIGRPERGIVLIPRPLQPYADRVSTASPSPARARRGAARRRPPERRRGTECRSSTSRWAPPSTTSRALPCGRRGVRRRRVAPRAVHRRPRRRDGAGAAGSRREVLRCAPQPAVLEHADVFITHAGMGGATEALWFGVPTVASRRPSTSSPTRTAGRAWPRPLDHRPEDPAAIARTSRRSPETASACGVLRGARRGPGEGGAGRAADAVEALL